MSAARNAGLAPGHGRLARRQQGRLRQRRTRPCAVTSAAPHRPTCAQSAIGTSCGGASARRRPGAARDLHRAVIAQRPVVAHGATTGRPPPRARATRPPRPPPRARSACAGAWIRSASSRRLGQQKAPQPRPVPDVARPQPRRRVRGLRQQQLGHGQTVVFARLDAARRPPRRNAGGPPRRCAHGRAGRAPGNRCSSRPPPQRGRERHRWRSGSAVHPDRLQRLLQLRAMGVPAIVGDDARAGAAPIAARAAGSAASAQRWRGQGRIVALAGRAAPPARSRTIVLSGAMSSVTTGRPIAMYSKTLSGDQ